MVQTRIFHFRYICIWFNSEDENNINKNLKSKLEDLKVTLIIKSLENAQFIFYIGKILMTKSLALSKFVHLVSVIQIPYKYNKFGRFIGNFGILKWLSKF